MRFTRPVLALAALAVALPLSACAGGPATSLPASAPAGTPSAPAAPASPATVPEKTEATTATPARTTAAPPRTKAPANTGTRATSDLSGLAGTDIKTGAGVLIDVAADDAERYLEVGDDAVDFTGTGRTDTTAMAFHPAPVAAANRVLIKPVFWNEEVGDGYCVADTTGAALKLEPCASGRASQVWRVVPAGDSGLFELHGVHGVVGVKNGRITTSGGDTALQILPYAS